MYPTSYLLPLFQSSFVVSPSGFDICDVSTFTRTTSGVVMAITGGSIYLPDAGFPIRLVMMSCAADPANTGNIEVFGDGVGNSVVYEMNISPNRSSAQFILPPPGTQHFDAFRLIDRSNVASQKYTVSFVTFTDTV